MLDRRHRITLSLLTVAGISFAVMQTLVIPALPFFRAEFGVSQADVTWLVTGFLLSSSVLTPLLGKLGDMYGKKRVLVVSLAVFGVGSLLAAAGGSLAWVVACRVLQGAGAAVFPLSFGIIRDEFPAEKVGVAVGIVSSVFGVGGGLGLVGSGVVLEELNWHWLFVIGAVPVLVACLLIWAFVPESPVRRGGRPDWLGAAVLSLGLVALLLGVTKGETWGWGSARVVGLWVLACVFFAVWVRIERRVAEPLVDLRTFARRGMAATNAATMCVGFSLTAFFVLIPAFVQMPEGAGFGFAAGHIEAGLYFLPSSVAMIVAGPLAGSVGSRLGNAFALRIGLAASSGALVLLAWAHSEPWMVLAWMGLLGTGVAFALAATGALVIEHSEPRETGVAGGVNLIMRTIGASIGAQVAAAIISAHAGESGFTIAFALAAGAAGLALVPAALLGGRRWVGRLRRVEPAPAAG